MNTTEAQWETMMQAEDLTERVEARDQGSEGTRPQGGAVPEGVGSASKQATRPVRARTGQERMAELRADAQARGSSRDADEDRPHEPITKPRVTKGPNGSVTVRLGDEEIELAKKVGLERYERRIEGAAEAGIPLAEHQKQYLADEKPHLCERLFMGKYEAFCKGWESVREHLRGGAVSVADAQKRLAKQREQDEQRKEGRRMPEQAGIEHTLEEDETLSRGQVAALMLDSQLCRRVFVGPHEAFAAAARACVAVAEQEAHETRSTTSTGCFVVVGAVDVVSRTRWDSYPEAEVIGAETADEAGQIAENKGLRRVVFVQELTQQAIDDIYGPTDEHNALHEAMRAAEGTEQGSNDDPDHDYIVTADGRRQSWNERMNQLRELAREKSEARRRRG
jgi:hypothetical protein